MKFRHVTGSPLAATADLLAICVAGDPAKNATFKQADKAAGGALKAAAKAESFSGKAGQSLSVPVSGLKAARVLVLGMGNKAGVRSMRNAAARAVKAGKRVSAKAVVFVPLPTTTKTVASYAQLAVEGSLLGGYKFTKYLSSKDAKKPSSVKSFVVATGGKANASADKKIRAAIKRAQIVAEAICQARDFVNEPAEFMTPAQLAKEARALGRKHKSLKVKVYTAAEAEKMGMGMFLAVGKGSDKPPKLIHITYSPGKAKSKKVALIGKGVTFDSGGYSLKPSASMEDMKIDMAGSAAVIASMGAIAQLGSDCEVHAVAAACENLVSGRAYKLGDVLQSMDGTTVEINNTDAEGRLTLGDAITFARTKIKPDEMFDFATLTGACMVALGPYTAAVMSDHDELAEAWLDSANAAGEDMWRLPLNKRLKDQLKSNIADMRNTGERWGGAITAGLFLQKFAKDSKWLHVDIAGPASSGSNRPATARGGTGFAVATIVEYLTR